MITVGLFCQTFIEPREEGQKLTRDHISCQITYTANGMWYGFVTWGCKRWGGGGGVLGVPGGCAWERFLDPLPLRFLPPCCTPDASFPDCTEHRRPKMVKMLILF